MQKEHIQQAAKFAQAQKELASLREELAWARESHRKTLEVLNECVGGKAEEVARVDIRDSQTVKEFVRSRLVAPIISAREARKHDLAAADHDVREVEKNLSLVRREFPHNSLSCSDYNNN